MTTKRFTKTHTHTHKDRDRQTDWTFRLKDAGQSIQEERREEKSFAF